MCRPDRMCCVACVRACVRVQVRIERALTRTRGCSYLPYVGMVTIVMNDYPTLKYALIGVLAERRLLLADVGLPPPSPIYPSLPAFWRGTPCQDRPLRARACLARKPTDGQCALFPIVNRTRPLFVLTNRE